MYSTTWCCTLKQIQMTLSLITATSEGIILTADSRQTYRNQKWISRIWSDSASKVFQLSPRVGLVIAGLAFLPEGNVMKNVSKFIKDFIKKNPNIEQMQIEDIAKLLLKYFESKYDYRKHIAIAEEQYTANLITQGFEVLKVTRTPPQVFFEVLNPKKEPLTQVVTIDVLQFILAWFNEDESYQVFNIGIPGGIKKVRDSNVPGMEYGAWWIWQWDVATRIIMWIDHRLHNLPFVQEYLKEHPGTDIQPQLRQLEYSIQWGTMTLQDAVDFSVLAIKTTSAIQRFSDGISGDPGDMPGVGGPVDVAVITPDNWFCWVERKKTLVGNLGVGSENLTE